VIETLSSSNGGIGWALAFALTGPQFGLQLQRSAYDEIFSQPNATISGAVSPFSVVGEATDGGYVVSGKSSYNSAHRLLSHMFFGGMVRKQGQVVMQDGVPAFRAFVVPVHQVRIVPNWPANAIIASESDDAEIDQVFVPEEYTYPLLNATSPWKGGAESVIPLLSQLGAGLAAQAVGVARGALDSFREMAMAKVPAASRARLAEQPGAQLALAEAEGLWMAARAGLHAGVADAWERGDAGEPYTESDAATLRMASVTAVRLSKRAVELVRDYSGMNVVLRGSPLERFARDIGAISQHVAVAAPRFEPAGRVFMGLPAGSPML
jgi:alkylation response protein AidB-like acyl-CoA dehydrogenase